MWVVYDHPSDQPDLFIARKWEVYGTEVKATQETLGSEDLPGLRAMIEAAHPGLVCFHRHDSDDPVIVETWI